MESDGVRLGTGDPEHKWPIIGEPGIDSTGEELVRELREMGKAQMVASKGCTSWGSVHFQSWRSPGYRNSKGCLMASCLWTHREINSRAMLQMICNGRDNCEGVWVLCRSIICNSLELNVSMNFIITYIQLWYLLSCNWDLLSSQLHNSLLPSPESLQYGPQNIGYNTAWVDLAIHIGKVIGGMLDNDGFVMPEWVKA